MQTQNSTLEQHVALKLIAPALSKMHTVQLKIVMHVNFLISVAKYQSIFTLTKHHYLKLRPSINNTPHALILKYFPSILRLTKWRFMTESNYRKYPIVLTSTSSYTYSSNDFNGFPTVSQDVKIENTMIKFSNSG